MTPLAGDLKPEELASEVETLLRRLVYADRNPSAWEIVEDVEQMLGWQARWEVKGVLVQFFGEAGQTKSRRQYMEALLRSGDLDLALMGAEAPRKEVQTGIDSLIRQSVAYRTSDSFQEMIQFMGRFRDYAPYNNMLVRLQNPSCSFYATETDWKRRFDRKLKEDARPMLILAPMHPVMLVYELDQTEGPELPEQLNQFGRFFGDWKDSYLDRTVENAAKHDRIRVNFKCPSSTNAGFATRAGGDEHFKMRIAIHEQLDLPSRYGTLCHELAHIFLGHLGTDRDYWWPSRMDLDRRTVEIEAEAVAFLVTNRLALKGASASYVSQHLTGPRIPEAVSLDLIAKVAGRIEGMAKNNLDERRPKPEQKPIQGTLL